MNRLFEKYKEDDKSMFQTKTANDILLSTLSMIILDKHFRSGLRLQKLKRKLDEQLI